MRRLQWAAAILITAAAIAVLVTYWQDVATWSQGTFGFRRGDGNNPPYLFWSGVGSDLAYLSIVAGAITLYRRHNCAYAWCPRIGKHEFTNPDTGVKRLLCWKHHPDVKYKVLHSDSLKAIQERRHLYFGKQPGRG